MPGETTRRGDYKNGNKGARETTIIETRLQGDKTRRGDNKKGTIIVGEIKRMETK